MHRRHRAFEQVPRIALELELTQGMERCHYHVGPCPIYRVLVRPIWVAAA